MNWRGPCSVALGAIAIGVGGTMNCNADELRGESGLDYRMSIERNPNYSVSNPKNRDVALVRLFGKLAAESEYRAVNVTADWTRQRYSGNGLLDHDEYGVRFGGNQALKADQFLLAAGVSRDTLLVAEIENGQFILARKWRTSENIAPRMRFELTPSVVQSIGLGLSQVAYPDSLLSGLVDYRNISADWSLQKELSEETRGQISAYATHLSTYGLAGTSDDIGAQGQISIAVSDKSDLELSTGVHKVTNAAFDNTESRLGWLISGRAAAERMVSGFSAGVSRSVVPGGNGTLIQRDQLDGEFHYSISEAVSVAMNSQAGRERSWTIRGARGLDRDFATLGLRLAREISANFSLSLGSEWSYYAFEGSPSSVVRSSVNFQLTYRPDSIRLKKRENRVY